MFIRLSAVSVNISRVEFVIWDILKKTTIEDFAKKEPQLLKETLIFFVNREMPLVLSEDNSAYEADKSKLENALHPGIPL